MQAFYDSKPAKLQAVGNGSYLYRYDIEEVAVESTADENDVQRTQWSCNEVAVWPPLSANKITGKAIAEQWDYNYEQKLINEYNAVQLGVIKGEEAETKVAAYETFLRERAALKAQIDADCAELGIA